MWKTRVVFVTVFTCVFLTSHASEIESTTSRRDNHEDNGDINQGQRKVRIDIYAEPNRVTFNSSHLDPSKDEFRYKLYFLACDYNTHFTNWQDTKGNWLRMTISARPYSNATLQIREKTTGKIIGTNSTVTPATEPEARVRSLQCDSRRCTATVENNCAKYNGYNMKVQFILKPSSEKVESPLVEYGAVNSRGGATIALKDLLPFTNYTVTANPANDVGAATDPSLSRETFIAMPESASSPRTRAEIDAKTTLRFSWNGLRSNNGNPGYYTLTFLDGDKSTVKNITDTGIEFAHLTPGKKYTLEVKECFTTVHCDILTTLEEWTEPEKPRVLEKTELQTTTDTTISIQLPVLQNPPGMHWILLRKYSGGGDEHHTREQDTEEKALVMVRTEREKERKEAQARRRNRRSADPGQNDHSLRIAAKIEVVEDKDPEKLVVVGGDWNGGKGLESDTEYIVFIVTETRAGPYSEYFSCKPRVMRTANRPKEPAFLGMTVGLCSAALFLICFIAALVVKLKKSRSLVVTQEVVSGKESL
ncbi:uncharacterized protein LOC135115209 isoform X1 [Scylla paramamosain]|uniref:uncharacterized protein LOC135115209 isoform X1 n=2 Tax=Scylla paramamosain TaxID=85552 RepID=UPI003083CD64